MAGGPLAGPPPYPPGDCGPDTGPRPLAIPDPMPRTLIKICCIASPEEARLASEAGADYLGLVGPMPSGAGVIGLERAAEIAAAAPPGPKTVLLTAAETAAEIGADLDRTGAGAVQVVRHIEPAEAERLAEARPGLEIFQVIHVEDESALDLIPAYQPFATAFLLDSGRPSASELGGTGRIHDWEVSAAFIEEATIPVFLAGGLNPANVAQAIERVRPHGVDICSGLRPRGALDPGLLGTFIRAVRAAA